MAVQQPLYLGQLGTPAKADRQLISDIFDSIEQVFGMADLLVTASGGMNTSTAIGRCTVKGDVGTDSGMYRCYNDAAVVRTMTADSSNPRVNLIVLKVDDAEMVGSGANQGDIITVVGTPQSGATIGTLWHSSWPALPTSAIPLAAVLVGAAASSISAANIADLRPRTRGRSTILATGTRTNVAFGALDNGPDIIRNLVVPYDAFIRVYFKGQWRSSVDDTGAAALFLGGQQNYVQRAATGAVGVGMQNFQGRGTLAAQWQGLLSSSSGLVGTSADPATIDDLPLPGQLVGIGSQYYYETETGADVGTNVTSTVTPIGNQAILMAPAGTYDLEVRWKASSGNVQARSRRLAAEVVLVP